MGWLTPFLPSFVLAELRNFSAYIFISHLLLLPRLSVCISVLRPWPPESGLGECITVEGEFTPIDSVFCECGFGFTAPLLFVLGALINTFPTSVLWSERPLVSYRELCSS